MALSPRACPVETQPPTFTLCLYKTPNNQEQTRGAFRILEPSFLSYIIVQTALCFFIMANRPTGYGMTAELQAKKAGKYDSALALEAMTWINKVVADADLPVDPPENPDDFAELLKNGVVLCKLINELAPGSVRKINTSKMAFKMMENIGNFLEGCYAYGLIKNDVFQTVDLYEAQNVPQVINGIHALGRMAGKKGFRSSIGPKESDENVREFTEEQKTQGKSIIGLQMGSNKGASQAGATPYGLGRQIEKTNLKI